MKITVRITGILEAEMELPEPGSISACGMKDWNTWHQNQYVLANRFIEKCATQAESIIRAQREEVTDQKP